MSIHSLDLIVHRRSNTKQVHPVIGAKRVSFHEDVIEPSNGNLIQIRMGECGERGAPEGQEDPQSSETPSRRSVFKPKIEKFPSLYVNGSNFDLKSQQTVLNRIRLELEKKEHYNVSNEYKVLETDQLAKIIRKDLPLNAKESIFRVGSYKLSFYYFPFPFIFLYIILF